MSEIDFLSHIHKSTERDYLARVNDLDYPKHKAAELAKQWGYDYWDGDRRINYGGYKFIEGRWAPVAHAMIEYYGLKPGDKVLDIGCGKGFQLKELSLALPELELYGIDISNYAVENCHPDLVSNIKVGDASSLPFEDNYFDYVFSINTLHNLMNFQLDAALREIERVARKHKYICVESYRNEIEKANLIYWQVTCEAFCTPEEWRWWFSNSGYSGDYSFIYFE